MKTSPPSVACLGECMVELAPASDGLYRQGFAGDTYNTAYYLKQLLGDQSQVSFVTALGDDKISQRMLEQFQANGLDTQLISRLAKRSPGLYLVENDASGERFFQYWRQQSAARAMLDGSTGEALLEALAHYDVLYLSGISLAILPPDARQRLMDMLQRSQARIVFDPNYRPALWSSATEASEAMAQIAACKATVLTTLDDERLLHDLDDADQVIEHWHKLGATEVLVKLGSEGCLISNGRLQVPAEQGIRPLDTTGAGDSFNAGYLAGRLSGLAPEPSARLAHQLAAQVIQYRGAILPGGAVLPTLTAPK
jgi:2-dehydro-3-deoxygluconokinase